MSDESQACTATDRVQTLGGVNLFFCFVTEPSTWSVIRFVFGFKFGKASFYDPEKAGWPPTDKGVRHKKECLY